MSKSRHKSSASAKDIAPTQQAMGYRGPPTEPQTMDSDPTGEAAYQRAFAEAERMQPARIPNAEFYTNSPSAQEYLRKRDKELFPSKSDGDPRKPNKAYEPPQADVHRVAAIALHGLAGPHGSSNANLFNHQTPYELSASHSPSSSIDSRGALHPYGEPRSLPTTQPPLLLEPKFGPTGPSRMLR